MAMYRLTSHNGGGTDETDPWGLDDLDGIANTLITHRIGEWEVMIGGGPDRYVLTAQNPSGTRIVNAISPAATATEDDDEDDDDTIDLTVGDQAIDYPREYVLDRSEVLDAIEDLHTGQFPTDRWGITGDA